MKPIMKPIANERGQMTIEMLLMSILMLGFVLAVAKQFQDRNLLAGVIEGPQDYLIGMAENGVWMPSKKANEAHPNLLDRHRSIKGEAL